MVYNLECKATAQAKNAREMKTEMDKFLGRESDDPEERKKGKDKCLMGKHLKRHKWLCDNIEKLKNFIGTTDDICVKSYVITEHAVPFAYLKGDELPLPIIPFLNLKKEGKLAFQ